MVGSKVGLVDLVGWGAVVWGDCAWGAAVGWYSKLVIVVIPVVYFQTAYKNIEN